MDIRGFLPSSLNEWKGRVAAVVFVGGCNWRCPYCHGWRFVKEPQTLKPVPEAEVLAHLEKQEGWIDGLVISGGEPTLQSDLPDFIRKIRLRKIQVKLETNGSRPEAIEKLLREGLLDCLCLDYKAPTDERLAWTAGSHPHAANVQRPTAKENPALDLGPWTADEIAAVRRSFALAAASGIEREYHTTLCPAYLDAKTLEEMALALEPGGLWILQQYGPGDVLDPQEAGSLRYDADELLNLEKIAKRHHARVTTRKGKG
jgi:pyruvate formate lyase activating enzyme